MTGLLLELTRLYQQPHRHYHSLEHVAAMLHAGREWQLDDVQTLAIWFHDAIYDASSRTNEEDSAALAAARLQTAGWAPADVERVRRIVLDTKRHEPTTPGADLVLDLDLMPLAVPWPEFTRNTTNIRREYAHVDDAAFATGRQQFFAAMLARPRLFHGPRAAEWERTARDNLRRAIAGSDGDPGQNPPRENQQP
jgi:predicted metal-dependent HD superfamily phosphohydrolase